MAATADVVACTMSLYHEWWQHAVLCKQPPDYAAASAAWRQAKVLARSRTEREEFLDSPDWPHLLSEERSPPTEEARNGPHT